MITFYKTNNFVSFKHKINNKSLDSSTQSQENLLNATIPTNSELEQLLKSEKNTSRKISKLIELGESQKSQKMYSDAEKTYTTLFGIFNDEKLYKHPDVLNFIDSFNELLVTEPERFKNEKSRINRLNASTSLNSYKKLLGNYKSFNESIFTNNTQLLIKEESMQNISTVLDALGGIIKYLLINLDVDLKNFR